MKNISDVSDLKPLLDFSSRGFFVSAKKSVPGQNREPLSSDLLEEDDNGSFILSKKIQFKLPLFTGAPHLCDPEFSDDHTCRLISVSKGGDLVSRCTGCGTEWRGNYKIHWMPSSVAIALVCYFPGLRTKLRVCLNGGYVHV